MVLEITASVFARFVLNAFETAKLDWSWNRQKVIHCKFLSLSGIQLNMNLQNRTEEEIIKAIKDKKNTDFCGIYELYNHDKLKKECFKI